MTWLITKTLAHLLGLSLMSSVSLRSPKIDTVKFDYELVARVETHHLWGMEVYEREDGSYYRTRDYGYEIWWFNGRHYLNEAREINSQEISITMPKEFEVKGVKIKARAGIGRAYENWEKPHNILVAKTDAKWVSTGYSSDFKQVHRSNIVIKPSISITEHLSITPKLVFESQGKKAFWQVKVFVKFTF